MIEVVEVANDPSGDSSGSGAYGAVDTYVVGDEIRIDVKFNEPVVVTGGGDVRLRLDLGTDDATPGNSRKTLTHPSMLNGGRTLRFSYAVTSSDTDPDGVWVQTGASNRVIFEPHDDQRVVSAATGVDADLTMGGLPTTGNARKKVDGSASASGAAPLKRDGGRHYVDGDLRSGAGRVGGHGRARVLLLGAERRRKSTAATSARTSTPCRSR